MGKLGYIVNLSLVLLTDSILNLFHFILATYLAGMQ